MFYKGVKRPAAAHPNGPSDFVVFVKEVEPILSHAFFAAYGPHDGADVTRDVLLYAFENWTRVRKLDNPAGYLYRVGQSQARWYHRRPPLFPTPGNAAIPDHEPTLGDALKQLTRLQRITVILIHAEEWTEAEVAALIGRSRSTVRTHLDRGLRRLRDMLGEVADG